MLQACTQIWNNFMNRTLFNSFHIWKRWQRNGFCKERLTMYAYLMVFYVCLYECYKNLIIMVSYIFKWKRMGRNYMHVVKMVPCGYAIQSMAKLFSSCVIHFIKSMNFTRMKFLFLLKTFQYLMHMACMSFWKLFNK
jgi:hypothetical protein